MMQRWDDLTPEEQARYENREKLLEQLAAATQRMQEANQYALSMEATANAERTRAEAAEQALALATNSTPGKPTIVMMTLDKWTLHLAEVEHFGADQWRNGNAGKDPQEFAEWQKETQP